ncbi:MAG: helix-turn-helix transcriptional regulator [Clostridiales bacterium]|nr:helix-turn-helix transcriptional regulator [Clostridiales bacterium]
MFDLGARIQQLRISHNMSQEVLGKKLNRSKAVICGYENNVRIPPLEVLVNMAVIFNVSLDYLVGIDKNEIISVVNLDNEQKKIIYALLKEFKNGSPTYFSGLTQNQQSILNNIFIEFSYKNKQPKQ